MINFEYTLVRQPQRKTLAIKISSDNKIIVKTSKTLSTKQINEFLNKNLKWIEKKVKFNSKVRKPYIRKEFQEGEKLLYLGQNYPTNIKKGRGKRVIFKDNLFLISVAAKCKDRKSYITNKVIEWYKSAAYKKLLERISYYEKILEVSITDLKIKTLNQTWGSCSKKGIVSFNWKLIMAPLHIIDYIVVHELCHLIQHNHSAKFWKLVSNLIPNHKQCKKWLYIHENMLKI